MTTSSGLIRFDSLEALTPLLPLALQNTQRRLDIFSETLRPDIFANPIWLNEVATLARQSRFQIRVLSLATPSAARDHPLVLLQERLPSKIQIRICLEEIDKPKFGFICADQQRLLYFNNEAQLCGFYAAEARPEARHALLTFEDYWQKYSAESLYLRCLAF